MGQTNNAELSRRGRIGGSAPRKPYRFGIRDIADAAGKGLAAVRKDKQRGKFDPRDLLSLARYLCRDKVDAEFDAAWSRAGSRYGKSHLTSIQKKNG